MVSIFLFYVPSIDFNLFSRFDNWSNRANQCYVLDLNAFRNSNVIDCKQITCHKIYNDIRQHFLYVDADKFYVQKAYYVNSL